MSGVTLVCYLCSYLLAQLSGLLQVFLELVKVCYQIYLFLILSFLDFVVLDHFSVFEPNSRLSVALLGQGVVLSN